ncbi:MAG: VWA domain-containing protein [Bacteroidales bacterium]|nr:VWA domain-containing protein [Bacteroidales bacterium]
MFRLAHPFMLYLLLVIPVMILLYILAGRMKKRAFEKLGEWPLLQKLMPDYSGSRGLLKLILLLIAWVFLVIGLADPQTGSKLEKIKRKGIDIVFTLDVSNSMLAQDIAPNRLERAKQAINRLLDNLENDRVGLVVFAGRSYVQMPLTSDYSAAKLFLANINPGMIPTQGTAIGEAIETSAACFTKSKQSKAIILITDGENFEDDAVDAAQNAASNGVRVYTIGMGLPEGAPIPIFNSGVQIGFKKDRTGNTVISRLNDELLKEIASSGKGVYIRANNSQAGIKEVFDQINSLEKVEYDSKIFSDYEDRYQFFLLAALLFLIAEILISEKKSRLAGKLNIFQSKEQD